MPWIVLVYDGGDMNLIYGFIVMAWLIDVGPMKKIPFASMEECETARALVYKYSGLLNTKYYLCVPTGAKK